MRLTLQPQQNTIRHNTIVSHFTIIQYFISDFAIYRGAFFCLSKNEISCFVSTTTTTIIKTINDVLVWLAVCPWIAIKSPTNFKIRKNQNILMFSKTIENWNEINGFIYFFNSAFEICSSFVVVVVFSSKIGCRRKATGINIVIFSFFYACCFDFYAMVAWAIFGTVLWMGHMMRFFEHFVRQTTKPKP